MIKSSLIENACSCECKIGSEKISKIENDFKDQYSEIRENITSFASAQNEVMSEISQHVNDLAMIVESFNRRLESNSDDIQGIQLRLNDVEDFTYVIPLQKKDSWVRRVMSSSREFLSNNSLSLGLGFVYCVVSGTVIAGFLWLLFNNI